MKNFLVFFIVICFSIISCKKLIDSADSLFKEDLDADDLVEVTVNNQYALSIPPDMKVMEELNEDASFRYANLFKETYTIVIDENKEEFINSFIDNELYDNTKTAIDNYADFQIENLKEKIKNLKIIKINSKIKEGISKQYKFIGTVENTEIAYLIGFVESKNNMYLLMSWTLEDKYKKNENTFRLIQESFKIID
jgi:hypothetical protein